MLRRVRSPDEYPATGLGVENWKREAAAGAFQENGVLQGKSPVQFKARTGGEQELAQVTGR
jgi:hypothetical protein